MLSYNFIMILKPILTVIEVNMMRISIKIDDNENDNSNTNKKTLIKTLDS